MKHLGKYRIPVYAVCAIEYGDFSGMSDEDEKEIREFLDREFPNGFVVDWNGEDYYFSPFPDFGLPTTVVDADFYEP